MHFGKSRLYLSSLVLCMASLPARQVAITDYQADVSYPGSITWGPDGALWFTSNDNAIGRITAAGVVSVYSVPNAGSFGGITRGPDGALWFTEFGSNNIGRMTTAGAVTTYAVPTSNSAPSGITQGPDGAMWFADNWAGNIDRITMTGVLTQYHISTYASEPVGITPGPDGALWFTESFANRIGRITKAGVITDYPVPQTYPPADQGPTPNWITLGPDGALWFTDYQGGRIGETVLPTASLTVNPSHGVYNENLTFTGSAFAPNETVVFYNQGIGSAVLATVVADSGGAFTAPVRVPQSIYGPGYSCAPESRAS
jgi:streptogramin lyase